MMISLSRFYCIFSPLFAAAALPLSADDADAFATPVRQLLLR